jgi:hypothetical protein
MAEAKECEINAEDHKAAKLEFDLPDGTKHYICEIHADEYAKKNPDAIKTVMTHLG